MENNRPSQDLADGIQGISQHSRDQRPSTFVSMAAKTMFGMCCCMQRHECPVCHSCRLQLLAGCLQPANRLPGQSEHRLLGSDTGFLGCSRDT